MAPIPEDESTVTRDISSPAHISATDSDASSKSTHSSALPILPCGSKAHHGIVMPEPNYQSAHSHYTTKADHINLETGEPQTAVKAYKHAELEAAPPIGVQRPPATWPMSFEQMIPRKVCDLETLSLPNTPKMAHSRHVSEAEEVLKNARNRLKEKIETARRANRPAHQLPTAPPDPLTNLRDPDLIAALEEFNEAEMSDGKEKLSKSERKRLRCAPQSMILDKGKSRKRARKVVKRVR